MRNSFYMRDVVSEKQGQELVNKLISIRKQQGLTQYKVAKLTGLSTSGINSMEKNRRVPNIVTCLKICKALDVQLWKILKEIE